MRRTVSRFIIFSLLLPILALVNSASANQQPGPVKVAFAYVGPAGHVGWSHSHDLGRQYLEQTFDAQVQTHYREFVPEGRGARDIIEQLAAEHDIVFTTSWGYMVPAASIAKRYPSVKFEQVVGNRNATNVANYSTRAYQPRYLAGMLAAGMSKSGVIGYVAAHPIPEVIRGINAFTLGARAVNPQARIAVRWTKAWYAPEKSATAAKELINNGADVLTHHTDSAAVAETAKQHNTYMIGYHSDMSEFAGHTHLASIIHNWGPYYAQRVRAILDNNWQAKDQWPGMAQNTSQLVKLHKDIPAPLLQRVQQTQQRLINGEQAVFQGPVKNHRGRVRVKPGQQLSDEQLNSMNWYVEGVEGSLLFF